MFNVLFVEDDIPFLPFHFLLVDSVSWLSRLRVRESWVRSARSGWLPAAGSHWSCLEWRPGCRGGRAEGRELEFWSNDAFKLILTLLHLWLRIKKCKCPSVRLPVHLLGSDSDQTYVLGLSYFVVQSYQTLIQPKILRLVKRWGEMSRSLINVKVY